MNRSQYLLAGAILVTFALFLGCARSGSESASIDPAALKAYAPLPDVAPGKEPITEEKVVLGRMLYYETRLSANQKLSCNSCHDLTKYGVDNQPTSVGDKGQRGDRNSPTVYNAAAHFVQFWDGRAADVEEQAKGPVLNPVEMAMTSGKQVVAVLKSMPEYVAAFQKAFPNDKDPVTYDNTGKAIGAFERKLITPARWDKFLKGEQTALTSEEKAGFHTFVASGCQTCHAGALLGGNMYQKDRARESVAGHLGHGSLQGDQERGGQVPVQGSVASEYRQDRSVFPRWQDPYTGWRRREDGGLSGGQDS